MEDEPLKSEKIHTSQNPPDMLTKVVKRETEFLLSFYWPSSVKVKVKVRNFPSPRFGV